MANEENVEKKGFLYSRNYAIVVTVLLVLLIAVFVAILPSWLSGSNGNNDSGWISQLGKLELGRFVIMASIVAIIIIITVRLMAGLFNLKNDPTVLFEKRFSLGKDLLTIFIGSLGTLMGFYFAENRVSPEGVNTIQQRTILEPGADGTTKGLETTAFEALVKQNYEDAEKAFDLVSKATPPSSNIGNISIITKYLKDSSNAFKAPDNKPAWKRLYCLISDGKMAVGMSKEINDQFDIGCRPPPPPANTNTATTTTQPKDTNANTAVNSNANANTSP